METQPESNRTISPLLVSFLINGALLLAAVWYGRGHIGFVLCAIVFMYSGRKLGWWLSRASLYRNQMRTVLIICTIWGGLIALVIHFLIHLHHPHWLLKWIFGFGVGTYISRPDFSILKETSVPGREMAKHFLIANLPFLVFVLFSILFGLGA